MSNVVRVVLARRYDLVVGDTFQLFYRGIVEAVNPFVYDILSICEVGRNFPRYYEYTPEEVGEYPLTVSVYDNEKKLLAKGETLLCVHEVKKSPNRKINILCVGDSLTADGEWVCETHRRLTANGGEPKGLGLSGFRFIGTCIKDKVGYEGYGGWQWTNYLQTSDNAKTSVWIECKHKKDVCDQHSVWKDEHGNLWTLETIEKNCLKLNRTKQHSGKIPSPKSTLQHYKNAENTDDILVTNAYTEIVNPFLNTATSQVDFKAYCSKNGFESIDAVYFLLTWNGLNNEDCNMEEHCRQLVLQGKQLVDILHLQYPKAKVKIMGLQIPSVNGGTGANYGATLPYCDDYGLTKFVMEVNRLYEAWTFEKEYCDFTEFIQISGQFDSDYNMPATEKKVNTRSQKTETIGSNGVHPLPEGYLQIADAVFRNLVKEFAEK